MGRVAKLVELSPQGRMELEAIVSSGTYEARLVQRAKIALLCSEGVAIYKIAEKLDIPPNTVIVWRERYLKEGLDSLYGRERPGKPITYGEAFRNEVLRLLETPPPDGLASWYGSAIAAHLKVSKDALWRLLRQESICFKSPGKLVCENGSGVRSQGGGYYRPVPQSTGQCYRVVG